MAGLQMKYFVLKPKGDDAYARASRLAMNAYADAIESENAELAAEINAWTEREATALATSN